MTYNEKIPEFALQPAKEAGTKQEIIDGGFDPTPYDRLLVKEPQEQEMKIEETVKEGERLTEQIREEKQEKEKTKEFERTDNHKIIDYQADSEETQKEQQETEAKGEEAVESIPVDSDAEEKISFEEIPPEMQHLHPGMPAAMKPMANAAAYGDLKLQTIAQQLETRVFIEEDILVPDIKPDLASILSMDGKAILSGKDFQITQEDESLRITGEVSLQTIYLPDEKEEEPIVMIASRLPFKTEWQVNASPVSYLAVTPVVEKLEYLVVNERKFRTKITLKLLLKEYTEKTLNLFENLKGDQIELKKEKIHLTHIALRKTEDMEISEQFSTKDGDSIPVKLLKYDINVVENHKQVTSDKMVINGTMMCNILYMARTEKEGEIKEAPEFLQNKVDFTQFILLENIEKTAGCKINFNEKDLILKLDETEETPQFALSGTIHTSLELYEPIEKEVVADFYHKTNDTTCDREEKNIRSVVTSGSTESSAREIAAIPEDHGTTGKILYLSGVIKESQSTMENGRSRTEGIVECQLLCMGDGEEGKPFSVTQEIPFRGTVELPDGKSDMEAESRLFIRDLWFDKINERQVELNVGILIETEVIENKKLTLVKNPCMIESKSMPSAPMVIYITKKGDTLWNIAKKYKSSIESIMKINELSENEVMKQGTRLLVVK